VKVEEFRKVIKQKFGASNPYFSHYIEDDKSG